MNKAAFPLCHDNGNYQTGMSLRDYFAGQALAGLLANPHMNSIVVQDAYVHADAMLVQREKEQS